MHTPLRSLSFRRTPVLSGLSLFAVNLHTDNAVEARFEGTRNAVLLWCARYAPGFEQPVGRCLDLLAVLPPDTVQRMSLALRAA